MDYSDPNYKKHIEVTKETLESIGVKDIPVVYVYNKVDLMQRHTDMSATIISSSDENTKYATGENTEIENRAADILPLTDSQNVITKEVKTEEIKTEEIIKISSKDKEDIKRLADVIKGKLFASEIKAELVIPYDKGGLISYFNENTKVVDTKYEGDGIWITIICNEKIYDKYKQYVKNSSNN